MTIIQVNGVYVNEDLYKFPEPDLLIQSVTRKEDLTALGTKNTSSSNGFVYFYIDKDWQNNRVNYVGETKNNLQYRHNATHSKKEWFSNLAYPLIGIAQSPYRAWDTDTRRIIESLVLREMKAIGMTPANSENVTWLDFDVSGHPEEYYLESVARKIVEYQMFHLGLKKGDSGLLTFQKADKAPIVTFEKLPKNTSNNDQILPAQKRDYTPKGIWVNPLEGRKIIAQSRGCTVRGYQTKDGLVVVTNATNVPEEVRTSASPASVALHEKLVSESVVTENGQKNWSGKTEPDKITKYLAAFFGTPTANIWKEDIT